MTIGRICRREVYTARPDENARKAARRIQVRNVGTLVVVGDDDEPVGLVTDRDLAVRVLAERLDPEQTRVKDVMTSKLRRMPLSTPIEDALNSMRSGTFRRVVVVDADDKLIGILSLDDVLALLAEEMEAIGALLDRQEPY